MEDVKDFAFINSTYLQMFGVSQLNVFFEKCPRDEAFRRRLIKFLTYFIFFYYPIRLVLEVSGVLYGRKDEPQDLYFSIASMAFTIQTTIKLYYYVRKIKDFRSLCLDFETFHTSHHRPVFSKIILGNMAIFLRRLAKISYTLMYMNWFTWNVQLLLQPMIYGLKSTGLMTSGPDSLIPRMFPIIYPFDGSSTLNSFVILSLEWIALNTGIMYALPIDLFIVSVFMMICGEMDVICKSAQTAEELSTAIEKDYSTLFGQLDDRNRIDIQLLIEDHQKALRIAKKIRDVINPMLGLEVCYFMVTLATTAPISTAEIKSATIFSKSLRLTPGLVASLVSVLSALYLYSWICGRLKDSEESMSQAVYSTDWYQKSKSYRSSVLIMMGQSYRSRPLRMLYSGNMGKETFFWGLKGIYIYYNFLLGSM